MTEPKEGKGKAEEPRDAGTKAAQDAELQRQEDVREAVAKTGREDLPKIGGPLKSPGLGR